MNKIRFTLKAAALGVIILAATSFAQAQATRTWVSGVGDDANPCSRTAPCKTFAGAISKTARDGEIDALDPGGFGAVTITKSITIDGTATLASILSTGVNGININITDPADTNKAVRLRGLSINGASIGVNGINIIAGNTVAIEDVTVDGVTAHGVNINTGGSIQVSIVHSSFRNCAGRGVSVSAASGTASVTITRSTFFNNQIGVLASNNSRVTCKDCSATGNTFSGYQAQVLSIGTTSELNLEHCVATNPDGGSNYGVAAGGGIGGASDTVRMRGCSIQNNTVGFAVFSGGTIFSYKDNAIDGNGSNIGALSTATLQ